MRASMEWTVLVLSFTLLLVIGVPVAFAIAPFYGALGICLPLVTYVPAFPQWLPSLVK